MNIYQFYMQKMLDFVLCERLWMALRCSFVLSTLEINHVIAMLTIV